MTYKIQLVSAPHRDDVFAEIIFKENAVAEVYQTEKGKFGIDFYPDATELLELGALEKFEEALSMAKERLSKGNMI